MHDCHSQTCLRGILEEVDEKGGFPPRGLGV